MRLYAGVSRAIRGSAHHGAFPQRIDASSCPNAERTQHAFQRAMPGIPNLDCRRATALDLAPAMYALANRIEPDDLEILATQLFMEMLKSGYTSLPNFTTYTAGRDGVSYPGRIPCGRRSTTRVRRRHRPHLSADAYRQAIPASR